MPARKIRLTLSGQQYESTGPIVDIDFNGESQDVDHEVTAIDGTNNETREYTVDVANGTYNLEIDFKNDLKADGDAAGDRNLVIEKVEIANDGTNYAGVYVTEDNSTNLRRVDQLPDGRWRNDKFTGNSSDRAANPSYNAGQPRTDDLDGDYVAGTHEGANPMWQYADKFGKQALFTNATATIQLTFS